MRNITCQRLLLPILACLFSLPKTSSEAEITGHIQSFTKHNQRVILYYIGPTQLTKEIESRFSVCDHLQQAIEQGLQKAEALRQSVLKKVFEGRLLTETELDNCRAAPDWEPAQQLLARIQSEKSVIAIKAER